MIFRCRSMVLVPALLLPLAACGEDGLPPELPLVVTVNEAQGSVQVTVDPEGTVFTNRSGRTTTAQVADEDISRLRDLMAAADLHDVAGSRFGSTKYVLRAGDVEMFMNEAELPKGVEPVLAWVEQHRG